MFYDTFEMLCKEKGISCKRAVVDIGLSHSIASKWKRTGATPDGSTLLKIANYFHVSVDYLLGEDGLISDFSPNEKMPATQKGDGLSDKDARLIEWFRSLPEEKQKAILTAQDAPEGLA